MKRWLARRERSGWSWSELSRRSGLPVWKLRWWQRQLAHRRRTTSRQRAFAPVSVVEAAVSQRPALELVTPSGLRVVVRAGFDEALLRRVLAAVAPRC